MHSPTKPSLLLILTLFACADATSGPSADLVLVNGKVVVTVEDDPTAEALAVTDGLITEVGSTREIERLIGDDTEVIDLQGRLAIPGFIEGHGHFLSLGRSKMILDLTQVTSWEEFVEMVADAARSAPEGQWITGRGWHQEKWASVPTPNVDGVPLHTSLSAVSPNNPVNLTHASGHASFANAQALEISGITSSTADPPGGTIVRDPSGRATGLLRETAQRIVGAAITEAESGRSDEERSTEFRRMVELAGQEALENGVTSFHDAGSNFATIDDLRAMADEGSLPIRLYVMVRRESNEVMAERLKDYLLIGYADHFLTVRSIKRQIDGALGSHGAWLLEPYEDLSSSVGLNLETPEDIRRTADLALEYGFQVNTHAIGDRANREVLDIYEAAFEAAGVDGPGHRWRIEHAQHVHPDDIDRFVELGVIAAMQGIHASSDGPWVLKRLGEERAESGAYLWRTFANNGIVIGNGTDVPVENIDPIASYYASVARITNDGTRFYPEESMTRLQALQSYTINNAWAAFQEDVLGSLEPGKLADIAVLSQDLLTIPEDQIPETRVDLTIIGGEVRFRRNR